MYSIGEKGLYINMYGGNVLSTELHDGTKLKLEQITNYPWDGKILIDIKEISKGESSIFLRIPGWCKNASIKINGRKVMQLIQLNDYNELKRAWKTGDKTDIRHARHFIGKQSPGRRNKEPGNGKAWAGGVLYRVS
jgi:uncharacterized protein